MPHMANLPWTWMYLFFLITFLMLFSQLFSITNLKMENKTSQIKLKTSKKWEW